MEENMQLIEETMQSYYEYIVKIEDGCQVIYDLIEEDDIQAAMRLIADVSEGLAWLTDVEQLLQHQSFTIESNVQKANALYRGINAALEVKNYKVVALQFLKEIKPLFAQAPTWQFQQSYS